LSHDKRGDHDNAIADFTEAIRLEPKNILAHSCRANAYRALGDEVKAASDENKAQELKK
jgi:Flp pilus assembly protein TadD